MRLLVFVAILLGVLTVADGHRGITRAIKKDAETTNNNDEDDDLSGNSDRINALTVSCYRMRILL